jgi:hypothetical protein
MLTNFETAQAMVAHHQQELRNEASRRRLLRFARRARHSADVDGDDGGAKVHRLPSRTHRPLPPEELAAS